MNKTIYITTDTARKLKKLMKHYKVSASKFVEIAVNISYKNTTKGK